MSSIVKKLCQSSTLAVMLNLLVKSALILLIAPLGAKLLPAPLAVTWVLAINLVSLTILFDLGISAIISRNVTSASESEVEGGGVVQIIQIAQSVYRKLGVVFAVVVVGLAGYLLMGQSSARPEGLGWVLGITFFFGPAYLYYNFRFAYLIGRNRVVEVNITQALSGLLWYSFSIFALFLHQYVVALVLVYVGLLHPAVIFAKRVRVDELSGKSSALDHELRRKIMHDVYKASFGVGMSLVIYNAVSYYYSNAFKGHSGLLAALVLLQMMRGASAFCQSPFYSKLPVINALYAKAEYSQFYHYAFKRMAVALSLQVVVFAVVYFAMVDMSTRVVPLVPQGADTAFFLLLSAALVMERCAAMLLQIHTASGRVIWHIVNGLSGAGQLLLIFFFSSVLMINVFPVALLGSVVLVQIPIIAYFMLMEYREQRLRAI